MISKRDIKMLLRSGSWSFVRNSREAAVTGGTATYVWNGSPIHYRPGSSDTGLIYDILLKRGLKGEYWVPDEVEPATILDIGGNIGVTSVYFAKRFPRARIHVFEPVPANFVLLQKNITPYPNVRAHNVALGTEDGELEMFASDSDANLGGYSFHAPRSDTGKTVKVQVKNPRTFFPQQQIDAVDLIKIDTEGSEHMILTAMDPELLGRARWVLGELHGVRDFELLAHLSQWFAIDVKKPMKKRLFMFNACNKLLVGGIRYPKR
jgi:FkbM family methyltransferase